MSNSDLSALTTKLARSEGAALLADRWLQDLHSRRVDELVDPTEAARSVHAILVALSRSEAASRLAVERTEAFLARLESEGRSLQALLPRALTEGALRLARRPHQPHRQLVLRVLDREPVRQVIRVLLVDALAEFGRKLSAPLAGSRVGKGLGALGSLAGAVGAGVLGAVGGELEKQVERRAAEFADTALSRVLSRLVDLVSDPHAASEQAELRAALVQGLLDVPARELVVEAHKADPAGLATELRRTLREFVERPEAQAELEQELRLGLEPFGPRKLGDLLEELGLRGAFDGVLRPLFEARIRAFDWASAFAALEAI